MKKITFKTNYNNKMDCAGFIHIAPAPATPVPESKLNQAVFIETEDRSHPGKTFRLTDFLRIPLRELRSVFTVPSHGLEAEQFIVNYIAANPAAFLETEMAIYFYLSESDAGNTATNNRSP